MNPADLDNLEKADRDELLGIIEKMQTRDRCVRHALQQADRPRWTRTHSRAAAPPCSLRMYNGLVERCFMSCVDSFRRKTLEKNEEQARSQLRAGVACLRCSLLTLPRQCVTKCCEKFLKHSARVSVRFAELNAGQEQPK